MKFNHKAVFYWKNFHELTVVRYWVWTMLLEKTLESPLDCKEIKPVNPKGNQSWIFIGRTDAEVPILWPPNEKNWLIWKDSDAGKESARNAGDLGSIPELGRSPGEVKGYPFQYSGLENSIDYIVHVVTKSQTRLRDFHFHFSYVYCTGRQVLYH